MVYDDITTEDTPMAKKDTDYETMEFEELVALQKTINEIVERRKETVKTEFKSKLEAQAAAMGFNLRELFIGMGGDKPPKGQRSTKGGKAPVVYRGPNGEEWSGRGASPVWLRELIGAATQDEFKEKKAEAQKYKV